MLGKELVQPHQTLDWNLLKGGTLIGQGSAGAVYRTEWPIGRAVAVKKFLVAALAETDLNEFTTEGSLLTKLRHPCVVELIGACTKWPNLALVMEYIPLGSLGAILRGSGELPWPLRIKFALDAARGMAYLHQLNVLHRDLKADNLLVASIDPHASVCIKVTDFSISHDAAQEKPLPKTGAVLGSAHVRIRLKSLKIYCLLFSSGKLLKPVRDGRTAKRWMYIALELSSGKLLFATPLSRS